MRSPENCDLADAAEAWQRFERRFGGRGPVFLSVVYANDETQALSNARTARSAASDGVILLNHGIGCQQLLRIAAKLLGSDPDCFVAVCCLGGRAANLIRWLPPGVAGVWTDEPVTTPNGLAAARAAWQARQESGWDGLLFGTLPPDLLLHRDQHIGRLAQALCRVDVPTILASRHWRRANGHLVAELRAALGPRPLAIAGAVDREALDGLLPHVNCVLTAARREHWLESIDLEQARELAAQTRAHRWQRDGTARPGPNRG